MLVWRGRELGKGQGNANVTAPVVLKKELLHHHHHHHHNDGIPVHNNNKES